MDLIKDSYMTTSGNGQSWNVRFKPSSRPTKSYFQETIDTAKYIYENKTGKLHLLYSGGMDSEYVFNIFLKLGFEFTPVIIKINPSYNEHDLKYAFDFCESKGITPTIVDINFDHFVKSNEIVDIATKIKCAGYQIPLTMKVAEQLDGFVVLGNDPPYMKPIDGIWHLEELELIHSILNFFNLKQLNGCPFFLSYSAEMMLSFLLDPTMVKLANNEIYGKLGTNTSKVHVYNNNSGFNIINRPKFTGYENIEKSEIFQHENMQIFKEFSKKWYGAHYEPYHSLINKLLCKL